MAWSLPLPPSLKQHWSVKVRDKERLEPPHLTVMTAGREWRIGLRDSDFLVPPGGSWNDLPRELQTAIEAHWQEARTRWNSYYPHNPV